MPSESYIQGRQSCVFYYNSQGYASLTRYVRPEDAIKLFLPSPPESMTQVATPLPKARQDWIKGFRDQQAEILAKDAPAQ